MRQLIILYADDDQDDREMMQSLFEPYKELLLITFEGGKELMDYLNTSNKENIGLVILDINMVSLGGIAALHLIRLNSALNDLPVIMFSNSTIEWRKQNARQLNAEVMTKPRSLKEIHALQHRLAERCLSYLKNKGE